MKLAWTRGDGLERGREREIFMRVVVTDVFDHTANQFVIFREQTFFHFIAEKIAEYAAKILMAWEG